MNEAEDHFNEALEAYEAQNYDGAIEHATKAIAKRYADSAVYQIRALSYYYTNQYAKCIPDFNVFLDAAPEESQMLMLRGIAYSLCGEPGKAIEDMNRCLAANPNDIIGYQNRGYTFLCTGKYAEAIADLSKAFELGADSPQSYFQRGAAYFSTKNFDGALEDFTHAADFMPEDAELFYLRGLVLYFRQDYTGSINDLSRVLYLQPDHPFARFYRIFSYLGAGEMAKAQADADYLVKEKATPFTFSKDEKPLALLYMKVKKEKKVIVNFGLDASPLGDEEKEARNKWKQAAEKKSRPLGNVNIHFDLPQGGLEGFDVVTVDGIE